MAADLGRRLTKNGGEMRKSLRLRDWQRVQDLLRQWEAEEAR